MDSIVYRILILATPNIPILGQLGLIIDISIALVDIIQQVMIAIDKISSTSTLPLVPDQKRSYALQAINSIITRLVEAGRLPSNVAADITKSINLLGPTVFTLIVKATRGEIELIHLSEQAICNCCSSANSTTSGGNKRSKCNMC